MDYSKFYHDWLQLDLAPEEVPNFYQILGVKNMEPDVQKIEAAFLSTLDRFQSVNGMTNPEAYTVIMSRVLEARKVFSDPNQKHAYDLQLSQNTGERVWKSYERPSFLTRVRQMSLIAFSFLLGLGVVVVMAYSVERNPDGSIIFREEARARKAPPFASQLDYVVYRPSIAQDYQPNGYAVTTNKAARKTEPALTEIASEISKPKAETQELELPDSPAVAENQSTQSEMEEFSQILSEKIATPNRQRVAKVNRRSPLYNKAMASNEESSEESTDLGSGENEAEPKHAANTNLNDLSIEIVDEKPQSRKPETLTETPEETSEDPLDDFDLAIEEPEEKSVEALPKLPEEVPAVTLAEVPTKMAAEKLPPVASEAPEPGISLTSVMELMEKVRSKIDFSKPNAEEAYVLLQHQTINDILKKLEKVDGALDPNEVEDFTRYTLGVTTRLSKKKHFDEAYQLCDKMKDFCENRNLDELTAMMAKQHGSIENYQKTYITSQKVFKELQTDSENAELNSRYAAWIWQEMNDIEQSIPYLVKCQDEDLSKVARSEMRLRQKGSAASDDEILAVADGWWQMANSVSKKYIPMVQEHAREFYRKVDSNSLTETQKARLARL